MYAETVRFAYKVLQAVYKLVNAKDVHLYPDLFDVYYGVDKKVWYGKRHNHGRKTDS